MMDSSSDWLFIGINSNTPLFQDSIISVRMVYKTGLL